jgi:hypothetical protein
MQTLPRMRQLPDTPAPYRCRQSAGKAVERLEVRMPPTTRRQAFVARQVYEKCGRSCDQEAPETAKTLHQKEEAVIAYFKRDDVTRVAPGMKYFVTVRLYECKHEGSSSSRDHDISSGVCISSGCHHAVDHIVHRRKKSGH